jgi:hypothetical protein
MVPNNDPEHPDWKPDWSVVAIWIMAILVSLAVWAALALAFY